mmetsp:Transcript_13341/g.20843  ORF Transcript_13341/g.20843 Transcript_13341/m.20843 type:complete len:108 (+) Transcript_13341:3032-3355(+)
MRGTEKERATSASMEAELREESPGQISVQPFALATDAEIITPTATAEPFEKKELPTLDHAEESKESKEAKTEGKVPPADSVQQIEIPGRDPLTIKTDMLSESQGATP